MVFKRFSKKHGFTLIELLVVIAIIGLLASIVLVNMSAARNKAKSAAIKEALSTLRTAAGIDYDNSSTYANVCDVSNDINTLTTPVDYNRIRVAITDNGGTLANMTCFDTTDLWCAQQVSLPGGGGNWCVDSTGYVGAANGCEGATYNCP